MRRSWKLWVSVMPRRSWSRFADLEFPDDPIEEVVGAWSRRQAVAMDARFCEAMERALAAERAEPEAEAGGGAVAGHDFPPI
jgi:hypothetical protein